MCIYISEALWQKVKQNSVARTVIDNFAMEHGAKLSMSTQHARLGGDWQIAELHVEQDSPFRDGFYQFGRPVYYGYGKTKQEALEMLAGTILTVNPRVNTEVAPLPDLSPSAPAEVAREAVPA